MKLKPTVVRSGLLLFGALFFIGLASSHAMPRRPPVKMELFPVKSVELAFPDNNGKVFSAVGTGKGVAVEVLAGVYARADINLETTDVVGISSGSTIVSVTTATVRLTASGTNLRVSGSTGTLTFAGPVKIQASYTIEGLTQNISIIGNLIVDQKMEQAILSYELKNHPRRPIRVAYKVMFKAKTINN